MRNILFQIATEYHYLISLSIIDQYFSENDHQIYFIVPVDADGGRGRLEVVSFNPSFHVFEVRYSVFENRYFADVTRLVKSLNDLPLNYYIAFHVFDPIFIYLSYSLTKKNTKCYMAPDGLGIYVKYKGLTIGSRLRLTYLTYRFFWRNRLFYPAVYFCSYRYGYNGHLNGLFSYTSRNPYANNKLKTLPINLEYISRNNDELIKNFGAAQIYNLPQNDVILFIHQGHNGFERIESMLFEEIRKKELNKTIIYKSHPNNKKDSLDHLNKIDNVIIISQRFPVELYISKLKNSIIISSHSTSMLLNNHSCTYYWIYPILLKMGIIKEKIDVHNPTNHIIVIDSLVKLAEKLGR